MQDEGLLLCEERRAIKVSAVYGCLDTHIMSPHSQCPLKVNVPTKLMSPHSQTHTQLHRTRTDRDGWEMRERKQRTMGQIPLK